MVLLNLESFMKMGGGSYMIVNIPLHQEANRCLIVVFGASTRIMDTPGILDVREGL
jgi:hypothetical protein